MFEDTPRYSIHTDLSKRVSHLRPNWNEESNDQILYERFLEAVELTGKEFLYHLNYYGKTWMPARDIVQKAFDNRDQIDSSGRIVYLAEHCPWLEHLMEIEDELGIEGEILYGIFGEKDSFRVRALPLAKGGFALRLPLPKPWRGLRDEELSEVVGIKDCVFTHASGFIGGNKTLEGAIGMARLALKQEELSDNVE